MKSMGLRRARALGLFVFLFAIEVSSAPAQNVITTIAGADWLFPGDARPAVNAPIGGALILGLAADAHGNFFIADPDNKMVFKVAPNGVLRVVAGNGILGQGFFAGDGGPATSAPLTYPSGVAVDSFDNLYILDSVLIRKVTPNGVISTIAGSRFGYSGDGGPATAATFNLPAALTIDSIGSIYVADSGNNVIRKITPDGIIHTVAGNGRAGFSGDGGPATSASLNGPIGVAVDAAGNLLIADTLNGRIRVVTPFGVIFTAVGANPLSTADSIPAANAAIYPFGVAVSSTGVIFFSDYHTNRVRFVTNGTIYTLAGNGQQGLSGDGGPSDQAALNTPTGIALAPDGSGLYIGDSSNFRVRMVDDNFVITTVAGNGSFRNSGDDGPATSAPIYFPYSIAFDNSRNLYIAEDLLARIKKVAPNGVITTFAGTGVTGYNGDGHPATASSFSLPSGVATDNSGAVYIADSYNNRVRKVTLDGTVSTVAGTGALGDSGDGGPAIKAVVEGPSSLVVDVAGNLYISDIRRVRKVTPDGIIHAYAGNGNKGYNGDNIPATSASLNFSIAAGLGLDAQGNLYIADSGNNRIRKVTPQGVISTVAGNGTAGFSGDGGPATRATLSLPAAVIADGAGNLYIGDWGNFLVRKVSSDGIISTIAGTDSSTASGDGGPATRASIGHPISLAIDATGNLLIADSYNNRIRAILTAPPAFQTSPNSLMFSGVSGGAPSSPLQMQLSGSIPGIGFSANVTPQNATWLQVTPPAGFAPGAAQVTADPTNLAPGTYQATINFVTPSAQPSTHTVPVTFTVSAPAPAKLAVKPGSISFSLVQGGPQTTQTIAVSNQGGGTLNFSVTATTLTGGSWLTASPPSSRATPALPSALTVTADPTGLIPGTYSGSVIVSSSTTGEILSIPVILAISGAQQTLNLSQTGLTFTAIAGGAVTSAPTVAVQNTGQGTMSWSASASSLAGSSNWLSVTPGSGSSDASSPDAPPIQVIADPTGLSAGTYYGQISISAPQAGNSPQVMTVVLNVLPAGSNPAPVVQPAGLVFTGTAGSESPGSQVVSISNLSSSPLTFTSAGTTNDGAKWFVYIPSDATLGPQQSTRMVVQPNLTGLAAGVYRGSITFKCPGQDSTSLSLLLTVAPAAPSSGPSDVRAAASSCSPSSLSLLITSLGDNFAVPASWPSPLEVRAVDDCGNAMLSGSVVAAFSNGDPPVSLTHTAGNAWSGTWQPRNATPLPVTVTVNAQVPATSLRGSTQATGALRINQNVPVITPGAVVSTASLIPQTPIAPGSLISILGSSLAGSSLTSDTDPLPASLAGTAVLIAGRSAPLVAVSSERIDAVVPFDVPPNTQQQVLVQTGLVSTLPEPITVAPAEPAIFSQDNSGMGQGAIYGVKADGSFVLADSSNPVTAGDSILISCAGLGGVDPPAAAGESAPDSPLSHTVNSVSVTIGGVHATMASGQLLPGAIGVYQVQATVPDGVSAGSAVPVVVTVAGQQSPPVAIAVR